MNANLSAAQWSALKAKKAKKETKEHLEKAGYFSKEDGDGKK